MKEKLKSATIRALWTMLQTAFGVIGADLATPASIDIWAIIVAVLSAGAASFVKSIGIGMPETEGLATDGEIELISSGANGIATGGVKWNPDFDLAERIGSSDNPAIVLGINKSIHLSEDAYRGIRI